MYVVWTYVVCGIRLSHLNGDNFSLVSVCEVQNFIKREQNALRFVQSLANVDGIICPFDFSDDFFRRVSFQAMLEFWFASGYD